MIHDRWRYWILEGRTVKQATLAEWAVWIETAPNKSRVLGRTAINDRCEVSTVFLGLDHNFEGKGPPLLFETMIFPVCEENGFGHWRWHTYDEAERGHALIVEYVRQIDPEELPEALVDFVPSQ